MKWSRAAGRPAILEEEKMLGTNEQMSISFLNGTRLHCLARRFRYHVYQSLHTLRFISIFLPLGEAVMRSVLVCPNSLDVPDSQRSEWSRPRVSLSIYLSIYLESDRHQPPAIEDLITDLR